tara:strand:- start:93264 stop:94760 length:1497 start_codon:yes stop_codon:yes gene_type:complete
MKIIRNFLLLLFSGILSMSLYGQVQIGPTITASEEGFAFGQNVQISEDGKKIAVSGYGTSTQGVAVFENRNGDWVQQSLEVPSDFPENQTIYSVAMSSDGTKIAVGSVVNTFDENNGNVKVFQYVDNTWSQLGNTIEGNVKNELFGRSIAISDDGNRVVVGARLNSEVLHFSGRVGVYDYKNAVWSQVGESIYGNRKGFKIGSSVAISADGAYVFLGSNAAYSNQGNTLPFFEGSVESRRLEDNNWVIRSSELGDKFDHFGFDVAASNDGTIVASGASEFKASNGYVNLFRIYNTNGILVPSTKVRGKTNEYLGSSVSLSGDGRRLVVGAASSDNSDFKESITIVETNGNEYIEIDRILNPNNTPQFGSSVAISSDGNTVVVGALDYKYMQTGTETGSVRVYDISGLESPEPYSEDMDDNDSDIALVVFPSPASNELFCNNCEGVSEWYIADVTGKRVSSTLVNTADSLDVSGLQSGVYYVFLLKVNEEVTVKKFIKK